MEFEKYIKILDTILRLIGMSFDKKDSDRSVLKRLKHHWICPIHLFLFNISIIGQIVWLVLGIVYGESLTKITYILPCVTMCMLGDFKICSFIYYVHHIHEVIFKLKTLECATQSRKEISEDELKNKWLKFLKNVFKLLCVLTMFGAMSFALGPFVIMASYYYTTGEIQFFLPFLLWYPFNAFQIHTWPFVYVQQVWGAWVAVLSVYGPDCFFFTCCTFIYMQFIYLQRDMEQIVKNDASSSQKSNRDLFKIEFVQLVHRHTELIRCVDLLNIVYSKSTLFNVLTSSVTICAAGFNLMAIKDYVLMTPFCSFLIFGMLQVFFYCYYGDYVMRSSMAVGDAVYNSRWYDARTTEMKYLLIVLVRSQKPCKFTAHRFIDVNLSAFTRILSTSWSYFALLNQMYQN